MPKRGSALGLIAAGTGGAVIAGFGMAAGRDIWKSAKKGWGLAIFLAILMGAAALPVIAGRNFTRGYDRGFFGTLFITVISSLLMLFSGFGLMVLLVEFFAGNYLATSPDLNPVQLSAGLAGGFALIGLVWGIVQRPARMRTFAIARSNDDFLLEQGIRETGGEDITHYDGSDRPLRLIEAHSGRLVFMAVGRRGKRAFIDLDDEGRMIAYSGVVRI